MAININDSKKYVRRPEKELPTTNLTSNIKHKAITNKEEKQRPLVTMSYHELSSL